MADENTTVALPSDAAIAVELRLAARGGDVDLVRRLLSENLIWPGRDSVPGVVPARRSIS
jgi:hypothetical protein